MVNENASLVKYEPPKCDECGRKIVVLSDLCAKCAAGIELNGKKQANRPGTNPLPTWPKPPAPPNPPPAPAIADFSDAYQGAREDAEIWKKRALEAEELNRKFIAQINGQTFMGEPAQPVQPAGAQGEAVALDVGNLEYMGNSVSFIYQKMRAYKDGMAKVWQALRDNGIHPDGQTHAADAIRKALAHPAPAVAQEPEFKPAYMEWHNKTEWVQEKKDWPFKTLGMHRADVMKKYIEHLEALLKPFPPLPSVGDHSQGHKPMKLIIGFNQVLSRKLREAMYSVLNDFIEKDDVKALCLEDVTFVAEIGDTKQLTVHWNKDQAIIASAPDVGIYEGPDWPLYELDSVIEESKAGIPFDETSLRTLIRVHQAMSKALDASKGG